MSEKQRTPVKKKAKQFLKLLKNEDVDYNYLREIFRTVRKELNLSVNSKAPKKLPYVPTEEEISRYYETVWEAHNIKHVVMIKTLLYTGVRVSELINIKINDINFKQCQIRINSGKGKKDRIVPFPIIFREPLAIYADNIRNTGQIYLFESRLKKKYTDRGIRKILNQYTIKAEIKHSISPHKLRHFLFTWMKKQGVDDALIQPYSGHESRQSLECYSKLSLTDAQKEYENKIKSFPV
jgi:integrase/recombinase XerD